MLMAPECSINDCHLQLVFAIYGSINICQLNQQNEGLQGSRRYLDLDLLA